MFTQICKLSRVQQKHSKYSGTGAPPLRPPFATAMEEEKAAAYYDELTRKGEGAARFKQGLGFSSASNDSAPSRGSAPSSSSSFLSTFVKASSPSKAAELQKEAQLASIQNKLKKKPNEVQSQSQSSSRVSRDRDDRHSSRRSRSRDGNSRHRSRSRSRGDGRQSRRRSRSRDRDRHSRRRSRSHSGSRSRDDHGRRRGHRSRSRERDREGRGSRRRRSRSESPQPRKSEKNNTRNGSKVEKGRNGKVDYAKLIEGYDKMTPAERVKAKMKLQISETVEKDGANMGTGWERFSFDKDAPLDDEEIEAAEDDAVLVKRIGQSFRFSAVEARKEDELKAAHDEAMFGAPLLSLSAEKAEEEEEENTKKGTTESAPVSSLISDQVLTMQQGSWRDRIRKT